MTLKSLVNLFVPGQIYMPIPFFFFLRQIVLGLGVFLWFPTSIHLSWRYGRYLLSISFDGRAILLTTFSSLGIFFPKWEKKITLINPLKISKITMMFTPLCMIFAARLSFNDPLSFNRLSKVYLLLLGVENHKHEARILVASVPWFQLYKVSTALWAPLVFNNSLPNASSSTQHTLIFQLLNPAQISVNIFSASQVIVCDSYIKCFTIALKSHVSSLQY